MSIKNIKLCSIPELTNSIQNKTTIDFENYSQQLNFFNSRIIRIVDSNVSIDGTRKILNIPLNMEQIKSVDYCYIADEYGKIYFYFISEKKYITINSSQLTLDLDVFQTYLFDFELMESFIDRCHVNRWTSNGYPTSNNIIEEGLEFGEHIIKEEQKLFPLKSNYLIVATNPLGTLGANTPPITEDEKEINREFGYNPSNPIPEWPVEEGGGGGDDDIPQPPQNELQTSINSLGPDDVNNFIYVTNLNGTPYNSTSENIATYLFQPITSGMYSLSRPNSEEDYIQRIGSDLYRGGDFILTSTNQNIYNPIKSYTTKSWKTLENTVEVLAVGSGILPPIPGVVYNKSSTYTPDKYIISADYGNYILLKILRAYGQSTSSNYFFYILIGFMNEPSTLTVGQKLYDFQTIGKTGQINFTNETKTGLYIKTFGANGDQTISQYRPYSQSLIWDGFKFGPGMYKGNPGNIDTFTQNSESFGENVYIPTRSGSIRQRTLQDKIIINNLTNSPGLDINTYIVAPDNCVVECACCHISNIPQSGGTNFFAQSYRQNKRNLSMTNGYYNDYVFNYVILKFSNNQKLLIQCLSYFNVKEGDILQKGDIIGTYRPASYMTGYNISDQYYNQTYILFEDINGTATPIPYLSEFPVVGRAPYTGGVPQWNPTQEQLMEQDMKILNEIYKEKVGQDYNLINNLKILNQDECIE